MIGDHAARWVEQNKNLLLFSKKHPSNCFVIRYEDMIIPNQSVLNNLFYWLGIKRSDKQSILNMKEGRGASKPGSKPALSLDEVKRVNAIVADLASELGYQEILK